MIEASFGNASGTIFAQESVHIKQVMELSIILCFRATKCEEIRTAIANEVWDEIAMNNAERASFMEG
jgi:hypothetical protein